MMNVVVSENACLIDVYFPPGSLYQWGQIYNADFQDRFNTICPLMNWSRYISIAITNLYLVWWLRLCSGQKRPSVACIFVFATVTVMLEKMPYLQGKNEFECVIVAPRFTFIVDELLLQDLCLFFFFFFLLHHPIRYNKSI